MKVKLASVGYSMMDLLDKKFCILYALYESSSASTGTMTLACATPQRIANLRYSQAVGTT